MRPFFRLPRDLRFTLRCLGAAVLILSLTLAPLGAIAAGAIETECDDTLPCSLSGDLSLELLSRVLAAEAGQYSYAAQVGIAAALLNRIADPRYPSELGAVIADAGLRTTGGDIPTRSRRAAEAALMGVDPVSGAVCWGDRGGEIEFDGVWFWK